MSSITGLAPLKLFTTKRGIYMMSEAMDLNCLIHQARESVTVNHLITEVTTIELTVTGRMQKLDEKSQKEIEAIQTLLKVMPHE